MKETQIKALSPLRLMFTTFMVILLLFVGLSTATVAWFSANSRVGAGEIVFEAHTTSAISLSIGWSLESAGAEAISFIDPDDINPMIPENAPVVGTTTLDEFKNSFHTATIDPESFRFNSPGTSTDPYIAKGPKSTPQVEDIKESFFIVNNNEEDTVNITCNAQIDGFNQNLLRIAIFTSNNVDMDMVYRGTISQVTNNPDYPATHYGAVNLNSPGINVYKKTPEGEFVLDGSGNRILEDYYATNSDGSYQLDGTGNKIPTGEKIAHNFNSIPTSTGVTFPIPGSGYAHIAVLAWYDGVYLNEDFITVDELHPKNATLQLFFNGVKAE